MRIMTIARDDIGKIGRGIRIGIATELWRKIGIGTGMGIGIVRIGKGEEARKAVEDPDVTVL